MSHYVFENEVMFTQAPTQDCIRMYVRCVNDSPSNIEMPVRDSIEQGKIYRVYKIARALNQGGGLSYYIKDMDGKSVEPFIGVPTWMAERFSMVCAFGLN